MSKNKKPINISTEVSVNGDNVPPPTEKQKSGQSSHQLLLEKLNDETFAREFFKRRLERIENGIYDIFGVTLGWNNLTEKDNEWAHRILLEIFETLLIRHRNFSRSNFCEELQRSIFNFTMTRDEAYRKWQTKCFAARGLDKNGVEIEPEAISSEEKEPEKSVPVDDGSENDQPVSDEPKEKYSARQRQTLDEIARQIEMAINDDKTPQGVKDCLYTIIFEASNEAGLPLGDISLVRAAFPNIIENLNRDYGRGIRDSIHAILIHDTTAFKDFYDQRLDEKSEKVLDLSESSVEDLARKLSDIMHDPILPTRIYNCLADEISEVEDFYTPENISFNLRKAYEKEEEAR